MNSIYFLHPNFTDSTNFFILTYKNFSILVKDLCLIYNRSKSRSDALLIIPQIIFMFDFYSIYAIFIIYTSSLHSSTDENNPNNIFNVNHHIIRH